MARMTYAEALRRALHEEMVRDESVIVMGEEVGKWGNIFGVTEGFLEEFGPERIKDTPISESAIIGCALGAAVVGCRPIAELMYVDFTTCAMDQIVNQVAKLRYMSGGVLNAPMVIRTQGGAGTGQAAQHSQSLEAWFMHAAGLKVVMPSTPYDAKGLFKAAIRDDDPVMFIEHKLLYFTSGEIPEEEYVIDLGVADVKREGGDVTIIATSRMVLFALEAAEELEKEGISCEVVDPRTLVPLDTEAILNSVAKTHHVVAVDEGCKRAGATSELAALIQEEAFDLLDAPIRRVAAMNIPVPYAPTIEAQMLPSKDDIIAAVKSIVG